MLLVSETRKVTSELLPLTDDPHSVGESRQQKPIKRKEIRCFRATGNDIIPFSILLSSAPADPTSNWTEQEQYLESSYCSFLLNHTGLQKITDVALGYELFFL